MLGTVMRRLNFTRLSSSLRSRLFLWSAVLTLFLAAAVGLVVYIAAWEQYRVGFLIHRRVLTESVAVALDEAAHEGFRSPAALAEPAFRRQLATIDNVARIDPSISRIFTLVWDPADARLEYALDAPILQEDSYRIESDEFSVLVRAGEELVLSHETRSTSDRIDLEARDHRHILSVRREGRFRHVYLDGTRILSVHLGDLSVAETPAGAVGAGRPVVQLTLDGETPHDQAKTVFVRFAEAGTSFHVPGTPFLDDSDRRAAALNALATGRALVDDRSRSDRFGSLIRAYAPIGSGSALLVVESFEQTLSSGGPELLVIVVATALVISAVVLVFALRFGRSIVAPIRRLRAGMAAVSLSRMQEETLVGESRDRDLSRPDEIGDLFRGFSELRGRISTLLADRSRHVDQLGRLVRTDRLTGLGNRYAFFSEFDALIAELQAAARGPRGEVDVALLVIDIDNFKEVNDALGHRMGDRVLTRFSERVSSRLGVGHRLYRTGGDEFAVSMRTPGSRDAVAAVARGLVNSMRRPIIVKNQIIQVSMSVGVALYPDNGRHGKTLVKAADFALQHAKRERSGFRFYDAGMRREAKERRRLVRELQDAMGTDAFFVEYQPKVDACGTIVGAEALLRWNHPTAGRLPPGNFVPLAEDTGLIVPLGLSVLRDAVRILPRLEEAGMEAVPIAVNLSPRQFQQPELVESIEFVLSRADVAPELVQLEITESLIAENPEEVIRKLEALRALGIAIAIDDFGTGYSSLSYLQRLPVDEIKIDRSFVKGLPEDVAGASIVRAVLGIARDFGLRVVAEGVEDARQLAFLTHEGCALFQGYAFSPPVSAVEFLALGKMRMRA